MHVLLFNLHVLMHVSHGGIRWSVIYDHDTIYMFLLHVYCARDETYLLM